MVEGICSEEFAPLREMLATNLADGTDVGASVAVVRDGETVVDLWGGEARPGEPWQRDTLVQVWSVTKTMVGLTVLVLAERGAIDLDRPVADYWPDFAAAGKGDVLVRHLLGHTSGLPGWSEQISVEQLLDLETTEAMLAAQEPWYPPGTAPAYQILDHGHLLDGLVRAAVGEPLADVFHREVAGPLGGGFFLGVPEDRLDDCADLISPPPSEVDYSALPPDHFLLRTLLNPALSTRTCNSEAWRSGAVGAAGGHGNARGIARIQSAVSHGGARGDVHLLSEATLDRIWEEQASGPDLVLSLPITYGIGYGLPGPSAPEVPSGRVCWWTGYGGAIVVNDLDRRTTLAYAPNRLENHMLSSPRTDGYLRTAFGCLEAAR